MHPIIGPHLSHIYHCHPIRVLVYRRGSSCPAFYTMKYWYGIGKDSCTTAVYWHPPKNKTKWI